jgi:stearoyl-CoA desaturase (delta-9 desaturase)
MSSQPINWANVAFLSLSPPIALLALCLYLQQEGFHPQDAVCFMSMVVLTGIAITAGYHRYYSHRSYECHPAIQAYYLLFGAAAMQTSVLNWACDHRKHHRFVDQDQDPHSIKKGFFWAHMGWIFYKDVPPRDHSNVADLQNSALVRFQHRHHLTLGALVGFGLPFICGLAFGRPWGGVLWGGLIRLILAHHWTFLINSAAHCIGRQPYSERDSSRDSGWLALFTLGEGHHNFHHAFPGDYRNGVRWYQWDPTKWWLFALSGIGLAWNLRRTPAEFVARSRMRTADLQRRKSLQTKQLHTEPAD